MQKTIVFIFFCLLLIFIIILALQNYFNFRLYNDFSVYSQTIWQFSRFKIPYYNHVVFGKIFFLGDHFNPSIFLIAPFYWISSNISVLLIEQGIVTFLNCVLIYMISRKKNLQRTVALILTAAFVIFPGTLQPLLWDWHMEPSSAFFLLLFIYFYLFKQKAGLTNFLALIFLGFKETNSISLFFVCLWLFFEIRKQKKQLIFLMFFSFIWFIATTKLIIPYFNKHYYPFAADFFLSIQTIISALTSYFKVKFLFISLVFFGFLPILGGLSLIPVIGDLALKFFAINPLFSDYRLITQYHAYLGVFLALASIYAVGYLKIRFKKKGNIEFFAAVFLLVCSLFSSALLTKSPASYMTQKSFWLNSKKKSELFDFVKVIPQKGSIMSQNNLLPYLSTRNDGLFFLTPEYENIDPAIIAFDLTQNQNKMNYWFSRWDNIELIKKKLAIDNNYQRITLPNLHYFLYIRK